jgi:hypothetical protein
MRCNFVVDPQVETTAEGWHVTPRKLSLSHTDPQPTCLADFQPLPQQNFSDRKKVAKVRLALPSGIPVGV